MGRSIRTQARPWGVGASIIVVLFALGMASPSYAGSENGNGSAAAAESNGNAGGSSDSGGENGNGADNGQGSDNGNAEWKQEETASGSTDSEANDSGSAATPETGGSSGDANEDNVPQPQSNADKNKGGANGQCPGGPYCSTDGDESQNGNGKGKAVGKPCAGCVGKADNKNPQGQKPNGRGDGNNGYECDGNNGIGKTNPAHTGCAAVPPPPPPAPPAPPDRKSVV